MSLRLKTETNLAEKLQCAVDRKLPIDRRDRIGELSLERIAIRIRDIDATFVAAATERTGERSHR